MDNKIEILRYHRDKTNEGYIGLILHNDIELARFNPEIKRIDLSVLNPFVGKKALYYDINIDTKEEIVKDIVIERLEHKSELGWVLYFDELKDKGEVNNASSED